MLSVSIETPIAFVLMALLPADAGSPVPAWRTTAYSD
jgi:hypothetical protein